jgi:predicted ATPase/DNA-binding SARP family transcriptional activator
MEPLCRIELLGGLRVRQGERLISRFRTHKVGALLAFLAYHPEPAHHRETLMALLWPEAPPDAARNSLSNALSSLRHQLEPPGVPAGTVLQADRFTVGLNGAVIRTDVAEFEERLRAAEQTTSVYEQIQGMRQALELYAGPLLPGYYEEWVLGEAARLLERSLQATRRLVRSLARSGQFALALDYAHHAVAADPLREEAHRDLMRLLAAAGQPAAALQQYRELETRLNQEMGMRPTVATQRLAQEIRQSLAASSAPEAGKREEGRGKRREEERGERDPIPDAQRLTPDVVPEGHARPTPDPALYPTGTVTFLLLDTGADAAPPAASQEGGRRSMRLRGALLPVLRRHGGYVLKEAGEALCGVFQSAGEALACALACGQALEGQEAEEPSARIALHSGDAPPELSHYQGGVLQHATRLLQAAHNGQILCSEATGSLVRCECEPGIRLQNLGVFRLRGQTEAETLFQVDDPQRPPRAFPPPRAAAGYVSRLPLPLTRFFGRASERRHLQELLGLPSTRLVTLSGPGGIGKTRLAIEAARQMVESLAGAVWFVPLADLSEADQMVEAILKALHLPRSPHIPAQEQAIAELCRQPCLLVLDNLEHLVEEAARLVQTLLEGAPTLTCLVTSRRALELGGEHEFVVTPLPVPPGGGDPEQLRLYESVQLFVDRAQSVKPDFQLTPNNAGALGQLCASLEGIPLALELAATRVQVLSLSQMLLQLDRRFDLLVSRRRDLDARHRTLRATIDWSYRLLSEDLQRFFARLSVFRGGWDLEGAERVCEEPVALDHLAQLRENSLIVSEEAGEGVRFRMLEALREYGWEKLRASGEEAALRDRHRDYFLALAEQAESQLVGAEQAVWLKRLEVEHDNLRSVLEWCKAMEEGDGVGLQLAGALANFWRTRGYLSEGRAYLAETLGRPGAAAPTPVRSRALDGAGMLACDQGDYGTAKALYEESLAIRRELGDRPGIANSLHNLGLVANFQEDYAASRALYEESLAIRREMEDRQGIASSLNNLGNMAYAVGDYGTATLLLQESLAISREIGHRWWEALALNNLGLVAKIQGDYGTAKGLHEESLAFRRKLGDRPGIATSLNDLGNVAYAVGDYGTAKALYEESLAIRRELGRLGIGAPLSGLGNIARAQGDYGTAKALYEESLAFRRKFRNRHRVASSLNDLGNVAYAVGDYGTAKALYRESLAIRREFGDRYGMVEALEAFADLAVGEGRPERAVRLWGAAEALRKALGSPMPPGERDHYAEQVAQARTAVSDEAFAAAWAKGQAMTMEQAVAYALEDSL